jgi:hypothetical protein
MHGYGKIQPLAIILFLRNIMSIKDKISGRTSRVVADHMARPT